MITYQRHSPRLVKVLKNGVFLGWLTQHSHRDTGLDTKRYTFWTTLIGGCEIKATTLTKAKQKIEGKADLVSGRLLTEREQSLWR